MGEPFFDKLGQLKKYYIPICNSIFEEYRKKNKTIIVGLSGGQGSGKSTIAKILKIILEIKYNLNTVSFSIDDFYKTRSQRKKMSKNVNFTFSRQLLDNMFWTIMSGVTIWTAYETIYLWGFSNDLLPTLEWSQNPVWFVALFVLIPLWSSIHF